MPVVDSGGVSKSAQDCPHTLVAYTVCAMPSTYTLRQLCAFTHVTAYAVCQTCGHFSPADLKVIAARCGGWDTPVTTAESRLRCKTCKQKTCKLTMERPMTGEKVCPRCGQPVWRKRTS